MMEKGRGEEEGGERRVNGVFDRTNRRIGPIRPIGPIGRNRTYRKIRPIGPIGPIGRLGPIGQTDCALWLAIALR